MTPFYRWVREVNMHWQERSVLGVHSFDEFMKLSKYAAFIL